ncbi:MAG: polysaccharide biosynthesis protein, partial [Oscillospiraceae bacterium]
MTRYWASFLSKNRKIILMMFDIIVISLAYIVPWVFIQGVGQISDNLPWLVSGWFFFVCCYEIAFGLMGMYDSLWRYAEVVEFFRLVCASVIAVAVFMVGSWLMFFDRPVPITVYFTSALFATAVTLYSRLTYRMYRNTKLKNTKNKARRVLVIGAGEAAATLLHEQFKNPDSEMNIICAVDDAPEKVGRNILGIEVMGTTEDIPELVERCEIETILLAIPTVDEANRRRILALCSKTKCNLRILPDIRQMMTDGGDLSSSVRDVRVEDLLGRDMVELSHLSNALIKGKIVMVTGGGGSIGSELCRQIASCDPHRLIIVDIYENSAYAIQQELLRKYGKKLKLDVMIASVRDSAKVDELFSHFRPEIVFHAAAHKHVPLMEDSPEEAVKNNVFGTYNCAKSADKYG